MTEQILTLPPSLSRSAASKEMALSSCHCRTARSRSARPFPG